MSATDGTVGLWVPARGKMRRAIVVAIIVASSLVGFAAGRATSDVGAPAVGSTTLMSGGAVGGHPVFAHRYAHEGR